MKKIILTYGLFMTVCVSTAQDLKLFKENKKFGYKNSKAIEVISAKYDNAKEFSEHLAAVNTGAYLSDYKLTGGRWGYIDSLDNVIIPLEFDEALPFSEGLAAVSKYGNKSWRYIDKTGKTAIPLENQYFEEASLFKQGIALIKLNGKYGYIDKTGKEIIAPQYDFGSDFFEGVAVVKLDEKFGLINTSGQKVISLIYESLSTFSEGLAVFMDKGKYGYIDKNGKEIIANKYERAYNFKEGLALVKLNGKEGVIDKSGKVVVEPKYDAIYGLTDGLFGVKVNGKCGFIDKSGKEIVPLKYDDVFVHMEGLARVKLGDKYGFIDKTGKEVIPLIYSSADSYFEGGTVKVSKSLYLSDGFLIDKSGKTVIKADFNKVEKVFSPCEGMQLVKDKESHKYGYLNQRDEVVIPCIYTSASIFRNNRAPVTLNGKDIYIDKKGVEKINAEKFTYTQTFGGGYAVVKNNQNMYAFIDTTGKLMTDFIYSYANGFGERGLASVCLGGKCGFLGMNLKPAIPLTYKVADYFSESGLAHVVTMEGKHGYINKRGEFVIPAIYDEGSIDWNLISNNPRSGWPYHTYMVKLGGEERYFDANGKDVTPGK